MVNKRLYWAIFIILIITSVFGKIDGAEKKPVKIKSIKTTEKIENFTEINEKMTEKAEI